MQLEYQRLEKKISELQRKLKGLPEGKLVVSHNGTYCKWYQSDGHNKVYISKKNRRLAEQLAEKKLISLSIEQLSKEKRAVQSYLKNHQKNVEKVEKLLTEESEFKNLLVSNYKSLPQELSEWMNSPYEYNTNYPERLIYKGYSGKYVRSKSEMIIDMYLCSNRIPFRYEERLELDGVTIYPDFTIRHPRTGETYFWEHFGMMDNPKYAKSANNKLQQYILQGIIPTIQLITTYETREHPLDVDEVERIILKYFLR